MPLADDLLAILRRADSDADRASVNLSAVTAERDAYKIAVDTLTAERDAARTELADHMATHTPVEPEPGPAGMHYGISAYEGAFGTTYPRLVTELPATGAFYYGKQTVRWSEFASVPDTHPLWVQTLGTTRAEYDAMLATFPKTRQAPVYLLHQNEPDKPGKVDIPTWQQRTDALYAAIAASGRDYVVPSVNVMYYTLQQTLKGTTDPVRQMSTWMRPGVQHVCFSAYAEKKTSNGHEVATISPTAMPTKIRDWCDKNGVDWSVVTGWAIGNQFVSDPVTIGNRVTWLNTAADALETAGSHALLWFNTNWQKGDSPGDYRIETDEQLHAAWRQLAT